MSDDACNGMEGKGEENFEVGSLQKLLMLL
jgi:hypothetical protein